MSKKKRDWSSWTRVLWIGKLCLPSFSFWWSRTTSFDVIHAYLQATLPWNQRPHVHITLSTFICRSKTQLTTPKITMRYGAKKDNNGTTASSRSSRTLREPKMAQLDKFAEQQALISNTSSIFTTEKNPWSPLHTFYARHGPLIKPNVAMSNAWASKSRQKIS